MSDLTRNQLMEAEKKALHRDLLIGGQIRNQIQKSDSEILLVALSIIYSIGMDQLDDERVRDVTIHTAGNLRRLANLCGEVN